MNRAVVAIAGLTFLLGQCLCGGGGAWAKNAPRTPEKFRIAWLGKKYTEPQPLSLVDKVLTDEGIQGARLGIRQNNTTGRFLGQEFELIEIEIEEEAPVEASAKTLCTSGDLLIIANLEPADLLAAADVPECRSAIFLNIRSSEVLLRHANCRANVFHLIPDWAMRADALAQYLVWKKWRRWFLVRGEKPSDAAYAEAFKRAAERFGGQIVEERTYTFDAGSRRAETGHQQIQTQMPMATQGAPEHDVVIVADTSEAFGEYLLFRTSDPRPVAGTHGLVAVAWHRAFEQWGGMSLHSEFEKATGRILTERDYTAWLAARVFGEVFTRSRARTPTEVKEYILSDRFTVGGFKGQGLTFRHWDHQMRQPILIAGPRSVVSISPQEGFLHEKSLTDTLGYDERESGCRFQK